MFILDLTREVKLFVKNYIFLERWRYLRWVKKKFPLGSLVEDCAYHPCVVVSNDDDVEVISLIDPERFFYKSCDPILCGLRPLTQKEALDMIRRNHG